MDKDICVCSGRLPEAINDNFYDPNTLRYELGSNTWSILNSASSPAPKGRAFYSMIVDKSESYAVLFGGEDNDFVYNDVWIFDLVNETWTEAWDAQYPPTVTNGNVVKNVNSTVPYRTKHTSFYDRVNDVHYIHGNLDLDYAVKLIEFACGLGGVDQNAVRHNKLYSLRVFQQNGRWYFTMQAISSDGPAIRLHSSVFINDPNTPEAGRALLFGGFQQTNISIPGPTNYLFVLDFPQPDTAIWSGSQNLTRQPPARFGHAALYSAASQEMWVTGGTATPTIFSILQIPSLNNISSWQWRSGPRLAFPAFYHSMTPLSTDASDLNAIVLKFGGMINNNAIGSAEYVPLMINGTGADFTTPTNVTVNVVTITKVANRTATATRSTAPTETGNDPEETKLFGVLDRQLQIIVFGGGIGLITLLIIVILIWRYVRGRRLSKPLSSQQMNFYDL